MIYIVLLCVILETGVQIVKVGSTKDDLFSEDDLFPGTRVFIRDVYKSFVAGPNKHFFYTQLEILIPLFGR